MITLEDVINDKSVQSYVKKADDFLGIIGYTEHGERHSKRVAQTAQRILSTRI